MDSGGSTTAAAIDAAAFAQALQRDLNCLSDPDRNTRRQALERLSIRLTKDNPPSSLILQIVWDETLIQFLLKSLHDVVEKCREAALVLISDAVKLLDDVQHTARLAASAIAERIGQIPVLEHSEEMRLSLLNLLVALTSRCTEETIRETMEPLCRVICTSLVDTFHEVKKAACVLLQGAIKHASDEERMEIILKALLPNITHAHSRVRLVVLSALDSMVLCGLSTALVTDFVAPGIKAAAFDHSDVVREAFFTSLARWFGYEKNASGNGCRDIKAYVPCLLPLLLLGITDESGQISALTLSLVEGVGDRYEECNTSEESSSSPAFDISLLPPPFKCRPRYGSRRMVQDNLKILIHLCLKDLQDWATVTRLGAARLLQITMVFAEERGSSFLNLLIPSLCRAIGDDELRIAKCIVRATHMLGSFTRPDAWLILVLDPLTSSHSTSAQRANVLVILAGLLYGSPNGTIHERLTIQISQGLSQADLFVDDSMAVKRQLLAVINNLIAKAGPLCKASSKEIFILLLQLQASEGNFQLRFDSRCLVDTFAKSIGYESSKQLYASHMSDLVQKVVSRYDDWLGNSPGRLLFQTVLQNAGELAGPYLEDILPVFISCLQPDRDPALRIGLLKLLDELFEIFDLETWWSSLAKDVIKQVLIPCGVWQPGKTGAAVRHAAMVTLGTFLRRDLCNQADMMDLIESEVLLPVVSSCVEEDFYVDTRRAACHVVENVIHIAKNVLRDDYRLQIASLLQKRLDDNNDDVRLGVTRAVFEFFSTLPSSYSDIEAREFLSSLVLHMDDQNLQIREAVCRAVEQCALRKPSVVVEVITNVREKHQTTRYCDYLLTVATSVQARE